MTRHEPPIRSTDMGDYRSALSWLRAAWTTLPVAPKQLHDRDIEDGSQLGSHRFSAPMWGILTGSPYDTEDVDEVTECHHEAQDPAKRRAGDICPTCGIYDGDGKLIAERGTITRQRLRYRSPMAAALSSLSRDVAPPPGRPAAIDYIVTLAWSGWDLDTAAKRLNMPIVSADHRKTVEATFLMHIRKLHNKYSSAPIARGPKWTDLSESQQHAILDVA